jgi:hypothetical protein
MTLIELRPRLPIRLPPISCQAASEGRKGGIQLVTGHSSLLAWGRIGIKAKQQVQGGAD